jgi:hypothetical protein
MDKETAEGTASETTRNARGRLQIDIAHRTELRMNNDYHIEGVENMIYKGEMYMT